MDGKQNDFSLFTSGPDQYFEERPFYSVADIMS